MYICVSKQFLLTIVETNMLSLFSALLGSAANEFNRVAVTPKQLPQCARKKVRARMGLDHAP